MKEELKREFGSSIFDENGEISRKALGAIVFSDSEKLKKLNGIVHPVVCSEALGIIAASGARLSVIDGSELEASGIDEKCRHIIVISARRDIRLSRIIKRDSIPAGNAQRRIDADYADRDKWNRMAVINTAMSGVFSSDRTIREYNDTIWHLDPLKRKG